MFHRRHHRSVMNRPVQNRRSLRPQLTALEKRALLSTFNVTNIADNGVGSLRYEIGLATSDSTNDTVTFDPTVFSSPQTITLTSGQINLTKATGNLWIQSPGANLLSVSGNNASRVFYLNGTSASLSGLTVTGGITAEGGGLYNNGGTVTLTNCTVSGNSATTGGGLYNKGGTVTLIRCTLSGNSATNGGGLDNFDGTATLTDCTVSGNSATNGGGLYTESYGKATLTNCTVSGNSASNGGGLYSKDGTTTLTNCTVSGNSAVGTGGGLDNSAVGNYGTATLTNCTVSGNSATNGGGLDNSGAATVTLTNCTVSGNFASVSDGGLANYGTATLSNCTVSGNSATNGVGGLGNNGTTKLTNTIVGGNTGGDVVGPLAPPSSNNLIGGNPRLAALGNYGGPTQSMPLLPGSPAIGAGSTKLAVDGSGNPLTNDERGAGFARTLSGKVDIGAFEDQIRGTAPGSQNATHGVSGSFALGSFSDQATPATSWSADVNWGDGSTDTALSLTSQGSLGDAGHTYDSTGAKTVTVTVSDSYGNVSEYSFSVNVQALISIAVTPASPSVAKGLTEQFTATGTYTDGTTANLTNQVAWASGTASVASISNAAGNQGLASTLAVGTTTITASLSGITSASDTLTVTPAALTSIAVAPVNPSVAKGLTKQFSAMGTYTDGTTANLTNQVTWASGTASVATVSNAAGNQGLASTLAVGTTTITASLSGITSASDTLTVTPAALTSIAVAPVNPSVAKGLTVEFSAMGTYTDGTTLNLTTQVTWVSGTASVATISNAAGNQGLASTLAVGTTAITARLSGITSASDTLTVGAAALTSIAVAPMNPSVALGLSEQFTAKGTYTDGTTANLTNQVTWASGTASVASISNAAGNQGLASTLAVGTTAITASLSGITSASDTLTVTAAALTSIAVAPVNPSVAKGLTVEFSAMGTYTNGTTANLTNQVTWASGTASVATISNAAGNQGLASTLAVGTTTITASLSGITSASDTLTVTPAALTSIAVAPVNPSVAKGLTKQFSAMGTYTDGTTANLTNQVTWASGTASVATVSNASGNQGLASTLAVGTTAIIASLSGIASASDTLTVTAAALTSIAVAPVNPSVALGLTKQFSAMGSYTDGTTANLTTQVTWASGTASVATISNAAGNQGLASTLAVGTTAITATLSGIISPTDTLTVATTPTPAVGDSGFETVQVGAGKFAYDPAGSAWTFTGPAGISANGSGFTSGNPAAPQGTQVAFVQEKGSFTQSVAGWAVGSYAISFDAARRGNAGKSVEDFEVLVDGYVVGTFKPTGTSYQTYTTAAFTVTAGAHTIEFLGLDTAGGDNTAFLDDVAVATATPGDAALGERLRLRDRPGWGRQVRLRPGRLGLDLHRPGWHLGQRLRLHLRQPRCPPGHAGRLRPGKGLVHAVSGRLGWRQLRDFLRCGPARQCRQIGRGLRGAGRWQSRGHLQAHRHLVPDLHHRDVHRDRRGPHHRVPRPGHRRRRQHGLPRRRRRRQCDGLTTPLWATRIPQRPPCGFWGGHAKRAQPSRSHYCELMGDI